MLHLACSHKQVEVVSYLVENRADINAKNEKGRTPLDIAITAKQRKTTSLLKSMGAQPNKPSAPQTNPRFLSASERRRFGV